MSLHGRWPLVRGKGGCQTHYTTTFCNTSSDNHTEFMQCDVHTFIQRKSSSGASRKPPARIPRIHDAKSMAAQSASIRAICVLPQLARQQALYIMYTMCYDQRAHHLHSLVQNKDCCLLRHRRLKNKRRRIFSKMNIYGGVDLCPAIKNVIHHTGVYSRCHQMAAWQFEPIISRKLSRCQLFWVEITIENAVFVHTVRYSRPVWTTNK